MATKKIKKEQPIAPEPKLDPRKFMWSSARQLQIGDHLTGHEGRIFTVTKITVGNLRTIVLFDGDMEIDFENYSQLHIKRKI